MTSNGHERGVLICDVGPRDGLQNEAVMLEPPVRARLCDRLAGAGLRRIEVASFVNPGLVPQMAGAEAVFACLERRPGVSYAGLVLSRRGFDRAVKAGCDEVRFAFPVTDTFCVRNQNCPVAAAVELAGTLSRQAREAGNRFAVTIAAAFGCPFEGRVGAARVLEVAERLLVDPPDEIILADTIGVGVPTQVTELVAGLRELRVGVIGCHFHHTRNTGIANAVAAVEAGVDLLDASVGGIGGCPFAPRASGNIATEDLVYVLQGMGVATGVDLDELIATSLWLGGKLNRTLPSMVARAGPFPPALADRRVP